MRSKSSHIGKHICVLAEDLIGTIEPNVLYSVELKPMHKAKGYVVGRHIRTVSCDSRDHNRSQNAVQGYSVIRQQDHLPRPEGRQKCNEPNSRWRAPNPQRVLEY